MSKPALSREFFFEKFLENHLTFSEIIYIIIIERRKKGGMKMAKATYKEVNGMNENMNGAPQVVQDTFGRDRKVSLCIEIRDGQTKTFTTKEKLKKEGCKWTTSGISSSWTLAVNDKEEAKSKYLEYKNRGYTCDIKCTDGTMHMPLKEANAIWGTQFPQDLIRELIKFKWDN